MDLWLREAFVRQKGRSGPADVKRQARAHPLVGHGSDSQTLKHLRCILRETNGQHWPFDISFGMARIWPVKVFQPLCSVSCFPCLTHASFKASMSA